MNPDEIDIFDPQYQFINDTRVTDSDKKAVLSVHPSDLSSEQLDILQYLINNDETFAKQWRENTDYDIDIFDPEYQSNPQLRGEHPGDSADLSALGLIPDMAKGFVNDAVRYGKQALTGNMRTDEELLARPELQGDAATVSDMLGQGMNAAMNFRGLASTDEFPLPSAADALGGAIGMYQDAKPELIDIFGEKPINQLEGTALLGSMILPGKVRQATKTGLYSQAAESAMDLQRKSGNVQGYMNDLTGKGKVKPDELRAIGFEDNFAGRNDISRQEVQQYINDNQINLDETILGGNKAKGPFDYYSTDDGPYIVYDGDGRALQSFAEADDAADAAQKLTGGGNLTKYSAYTLGGGAQNNNYREILIQLPKGRHADQNELDSLLQAQKGDISPELTAASAEANKLNEEMITTAQEFMRRDGGVPLDVESKRISARDKAYSISEEIQTRKHDLREKIVNLQFNIDQDQRGLTYQGGHYSGVDNVAMTLRLNDRVDTENKKGLLIEEIQDDWASAGKDFGYKNTAETKALSKELDRLEEINNSYLKQQQEFQIQGIPEDIEFTTKVVRNYRDTLDARYRLQEVLSKEENSLPDRPFKAADKSSDYNVAIKRALVEAANGDYDRLYLTTGQQQADRYDLSKQINEVRLAGDVEHNIFLKQQQKEAQNRYDKAHANYTAHGDKAREAMANLSDELPDLYSQDNPFKAEVEGARSDLLYFNDEAHRGRITISAFDKNDSPVIMQTIESFDELPALIGKDAAKSLVEKPFEEGMSLTRILKGQDLSIGGEGMKQFYDQTYRNALGKLVKPYGVKVGQADLPSTIKATALDLPEEYYRLQATSSARELTPDETNRLQQLNAEFKKGKGTRVDTVYSVDITPKMREDFKNGIPMFAGGGAVDTTDIFEYNLGGSVSQMMRDPDEERAAGPTGPQAASFAMNLPPGAGLTDAFGYMPRLPGSEAGYEDIFDQPNYPSMAANIGQGEYLDAGFQGLGVLGDLATAVPFVGPALGALIKTPGALRKASKLSKLKDSSTGGIDSLAQDIVRVPDGIDTIDNARIISAKAGLTKKQTINALRDQFMLDHVPVGELTTISGKPAPATESLIKKRANAYVKRINNNPAVYRRESYRLGQSNQTTPLQERRIIHPEELLGKTGVPVVGDRSIRLVGDDKAGRGIESIAGVPLSSEHIAQGGLEYTIDNAGKTIILPGGAETNRAWASMKDAANKKQANFAYAAEQADSDAVIGVFSAMAKNSINFTADSLIPMMKQLPAIRIPKKDIKAFDDKIRKGVEKIDADGKVTTTARPDWLGLEHPEVFDQLLGKGEFSRDGAGAFRKTIIEEMMKKNWEDLGFPVYDDMIETMTVPELGKFMTGESGMSMFTGNPKAITFADEDHLSYGTSIPGDYFGGLKGSVPPEVMYPKMFDMLSKQMTNPKKGTPRPLNYSEQVGSLMMNPKLYETYDAESIEGIVNYMNKNLGTDYAEGGEVSSEDQVDIFDV